MWVVPNVFYGKGNGILGGVGEDDGVYTYVVDDLKNRYADTWVTLAIQPAGGIQAVEPLFRGGVPRGTGDFAGYVLLQYHVSVICEAGGDGQWHDRGSSPSWNTLPPGDPETWTTEQLAMWANNLPWDMNINVKDDTAASRQEAGETWAAWYGEHFPTAPNNGHPLKADDVRVGSVTLLSQTADTLSFRVELGDGGGHGLLYGSVRRRHLCPGYGGTGGVRHPHPVPDPGAGHRPHLPLDLVDGRSARVNEKPRRMTAIRRGFVLSYLEGRRDLSFRALSMLPSTFSLPRRTAPMGSDCPEAILKRVSAEQVKRASRSR